MKKGRINGVGIWYDKNNNPYHINVSYVGTDLVYHYNIKDVPEKVLDYCEKAPNHDGITLSDGRTMCAFYD